MAKKCGSLISEFRAFILRGNVIDLAVGVIIGGAFNKIVTSLVNDLLMPLISLVIGRGQLSGMFIALDGNDYGSVETAMEKTSVVYYGSFLATVLDFLLMGLVIFALVKIITLVRVKFEKAPEPAVDEAPQTKVCPLCMSEIHIDATVCPNCTREIAQV